MKANEASANAGAAAADGAGHLHPERTKRRRRVIIALIVIAFHIMGLLSSIHAVMTARTAQGAIAWGVSLNAFPYLAVPAYWVLGRRSFQGYVEA